MPSFIEILIGNSLSAMLQRKETEQFVFVIGGAEGLQISV